MALNAVYSQILPPTCIHHAVQLSIAKKECILVAAVNRLRLFHVARVPASSSSSNRNQKNEDVQEHTEKNNIEYKLNLLWEEAIQGVVQSMASVSLVSGGDDCVLLSFPDAKVQFPFYFVPLNGFLDEHFNLESDGMRICYFISSFV